MTRFDPLDLSGLKDASIKDRVSKVGRDQSARPWAPGESFGRWLEGLPRTLAAADLLEIADRWADAVRNRRTVILAMGGHPVKVGLSPVIIDLMKRGAVSLLAVNGSVMVHDAEMAMIGATSEDVAATLGAGRFGVGRETAEIINRSAGRAGDDGPGLGRALGEALDRGGYPYAGDSLLAAARRLDVSATVHVALGTDVYHIHPSADGAALGRASLYDFRVFAAAVGRLAGGLFINLGSAVVMPEVFLKALTAARNLGCDPSGLTTVNMDFIRHYRPAVNVVERPTLESGRGFHLTGHHEIMLPLLAAALIERL